jgi:hypothetical protein
MANTAKQKYIIVTSQGKEAQVTATRVEEDETSSLIKFYDGDNLVGSFRSYSSFHPVSE